MRVLLLRHGQTDLNVQKRLQGSSDIPLNERGREQARETKAFLDKQGLKVTRIISSPLERAIETGSLATVFLWTRWRQMQILSRWLLVYVSSETWKKRIRLSCISA
ncbi:MAG: histidine phosphatase family protein, partial [Pseudobutyrivibrio sp.]|nr:histidine phosphatase family protein [Pseudobutyrivibrio sp.]